MNPITEILQKFGIDSVELIRGNIQSAGQNASGETSQSLQWQTPTDTRLIVDGARYIYVLETGRRPGKMPPVSKILSWIESKGISFEGKAESLAWAISKKIAQQGTTLFKEGGRKDIITPALADSRFDKLTGAIAAVSVAKVLKTMEPYVEKK